MKTEIVVPQLGLMEEFVLAEWIRPDGAVVAQGESIAVIETDKVNAELEAPAPGRLEIAVPAGSDPLPVETVLGHIIEAAG